MSEPVDGTKVMLYFHDSDTDTDIPFACGQTSYFKIDPSFKDVTDYQSAFYGKRKPDISWWEMGIQGLVILSNYSYLFITNLIASRASMLAKFVVDNGADGLVIYSGNCYPSAFNLTGNYNEAAVYTTTLLGSGAWNSTGTQVTPGGIVVEGGSVTRYEYTVSASSLVITVNATIGANTIVELNRGGSNVTEMIFTGSPTGNQVLWKPDGTFTVASGNDWLIGEELSGSYK